MRTAFRAPLHVTAGVAMVLLAPAALAAGQQPGMQDGPGGAGQPMGQMPGGMGMGQMMRPGAGMRQGGQPQMVATSDYLYVLRGNTLYQMSTRDITQVKKVTLPAEQRMGPQGPGGMPGGPGMPGGGEQNYLQEPQGPGFGGMQGGGMGQGPGGRGGMGQMGMGPGMGMMPGMGGGPQATLAANNDYAFVLRGLTIFQISAKSMQIVKTVTLPVEVGPGMGMPGMGMQGMPGMGGSQGQSGRRRGGGGQQQ